MRKKQLSVIIVFLILSFFFTPPTHRAFAYMPQISFDELAQLADIVFIGTVAEQTPKIARDRRTVKTQVVFEQIEIIHLRDTVAENIGSGITLTYSGGRFNEAVTYISDMPRVETGTRYMVFAHYDGQDHTNPFVGGQQGLLKIATDEITGKQYPLSMYGSGIAGVQGERVSLTRPLKKMVNGIPEWKEANTKIKRAPPPLTPEGRSIASRSIQSGPPETLLNVGELTDHVRQALLKTPTAAVEKKLQARAAEATTRKAASAAPVKPKKHSWEFAADGKLIILDPANAKCRTPKNQTTAATGVLNYSRTPMGSTSWDDIFIYGWMDLPSTLYLVPENYMTYMSDIIVQRTYNNYIDDMIAYRDYSNGFVWLNGWSELCGMLTDGQEEDIFGKGWGSSTWARTHYTGAVCKDCEIFETDISFNAALNWVGNHVCQLHRADMTAFDGICKDAILYLPVALHEMGHTLGLMAGDEDYAYDVPTIMNGGLESAVEDGRGLHVGDTYLLRYWYGDQRNDAQMDHEDIGIESWYTQGGAKNATTDKTQYSPGQNITINNFTVENIGRHAAPDVRVRAYLSADEDLLGLLDEVNELDLTKIPTDRVLTLPSSDNYYQWETLEPETFWTGDRTFQIPLNIPEGTYRVHLVVTANNDQSIHAPADGDTSYHEVTALNNHTFLYKTIDIVYPKPNAPANLMEQGTDEGGIGLVWDAVLDATHYQVLRSEGDGPISAPFGWTTLTEAKDATAVPLVPYNYWVVAYNAFGARSDSGPSITASRPMSPPCIESASDGLTSGMILIKAQPVDKARSYCFYYSDVGNNPLAAKVVPGACPSVDNLAIHSNADPGQTYYYFATASRYADGAYATSMGGACPDKDNAGSRILPPPSGVTATIDSDDYIEVSWSASTGASAYRVYRNTENNPDTAVPLGATWTDKTFYTDYDAAIEAGKIYYYWVRAARSDVGDGLSEFSAVAHGTKLYEPAPMVTMADGATDGASPAKITISWQAMTWPVATYFYKVYRGEYGTAGVSDSGDAGKATAISGWLSATSFEDATATPGKDYWYWVSSALSDAGLRESVWWLCPYCVDSGWRRLLPVPTADVTASDGEFFDRIRVTWAPLEGVSHYKVYRGTDALYTSSTLVSPVVSGTAFDDTDAAIIPKATYFYWVTSAVDADGHRESNRTGLGSAGWREAAPPADVTASAGVYTDKIRVTWSPVSGEVRYKIYRSTTNDPSTAEAVSAYFQIETTYDDIYASAGQIYYYWIDVRPWPCREGCVISPLSAVVSGYRAITPPSDIQASDGAYMDKVKVTWKSNGGPYFRVYRSTTDSIQDAHPVSGWLNALTFTDTVDLKVGATYYYFIAAARDKFGAQQSAPGACDSGYLALAPPTDVMATEGVFYTSVGLSWNKGAQEATHYRVYRSEDYTAATPQPISGWRTATYYDDTSASPGITYYYWVTEAIDQNGTLESVLSPSGSGEGGWAFGEMAGDVDGNRTVELRDAIMALKVLTRPQIDAGTGSDINAEFNIRAGADINNDGKIGLEEALYILLTIAYPEIPGYEWH